MVLFKSLHHKWIWISERKTLKIATRLYQLASDKNCIGDINKRFREIEFTKEQLHDLRYRRKER